MEGPTRARRTLVKVCGLTRLEDARAALEAGADWLGFVVEGESPRRVDPSAAADVVAALPGAHAVAVMVSPTPEAAIRHARRMGAERVQLHGVDPASWPKGFPFPLLFAIPVEADGRLARTLPPPETLVLLDSAGGLHAGGTGRTFPWDAAAGIAARRDVMLAGGLGPDNVEAAIERVRPFGVDASSRLESAPGIKDAERVRRFVAAVRRADAVRA